MTCIIECGLSIQYFNIFLIFQEEHESFHDISDRMIEEKEREIAKLLNENKDLHHSLEAKAAVSYSIKPIHCYLCLLY